MKEDQEMKKHKEAIEALAVKAGLLAEKAAQCADELVKKANGALVEVKKLVGK